MSQSSTPFAEGICPSVRGCRVVVLCSHRSSIFVGIVIRCHPSRRSPSFPACHCRCLAVGIILGKTSIINPSDIIFTAIWEQNRKVRNNNSASNRTNKKPKKQETEQYYSGRSNSTEHPERTSVPQMEPNAG